MFRFLGNAVVRTWPFLLAGWILLMLAVSVRAPVWTDVTEDGEFTFLPKQVPSRQAKDVFDEALNRLQTKRARISGQLSDQLSDGMLAQLTAELAADGNHDDASGVIQTPWVPTRQSTGVERDPFSANRPD